MKDLNELGLEELYAELTKGGLARRLIQLARDEDLGEPGDLTSRVCIKEGTIGEAAIAAREEGIVAGMRVLPTVLEVFAPNVAMEARAADGKPVEAGSVMGFLRGPMREILAAERTLLNLLGRLCGVAGLTREFVCAAGWNAAAVYDTRKTTPGLRVLEKYAVRCGGGRCHRLGLHDAVMIKDNHLAGVGLKELAKFITDAAGKARALAAETGRLRFVEVEVESLDQLTCILGAGGCGVDVILLDNMNLGLLVQASELRDRSKLTILLEASGGVRLETIAAVAATGVDRVSIGELTHGAVSMDVALDVAVV